MKNQQSKSNYNIQDLNIVYESWYEVDEDIIFPIRVHIKDIKYKRENKENLKVEFLRQSMRINEKENPFKELYERLSIKEEIMKYLKYIDDRKMFNNCTENYIKHYFNCNTLEQFYEYIMQEGFSDGMFSRLKKEIDFIIDEIKNKFKKIIFEILEYEKEMPSLYKIKNDIPQDVKELMVYTSDMAISQPWMEYTNSIIFEENIGKACIDYSWREIEYKTIYVSKKYKVDGAFNQYQSWKMEQERKKNS